MKERKPLAMWALRHPNGSLCGLVEYTRSEVVRKLLAEQPTIVWKEHLRLGYRPVKVEVREKK
jgi:hypothetical protein